MIGERASGNYCRLRCRCWTLHGHTVGKHCVGLRMKVPVSGLLSKWRVIYFATLFTGRKILRQFVGGNEVVIHQIHDGNGFRLELTYFLVYEEDMALDIICLRPDHGKPNQNLRPAHQMATTLPCNPTIAYGQAMVNPDNGYGRAMANPTNGYGQAMTKPINVCDQAMAIPINDCNQATANPPNDYGQATANVYGQAMAAFHPISLMKHPCKNMSNVYTLTKLMANLVCSLLTSLPSFSPHRKCHEPRGIRCNVIPVCTISDILSCKTRHSPLWYPPTTRLSGWPWLRPK